MNGESPERILIVNDESEMRKMLCELIESAGLGATAVSDGETMRAELGVGGYSLLILDLHLKRENGLALAREVRATSGIPIMMVTGKGDETDRILGLELAADDYLMKPFNPRELLARVRALLRRAGGELTTQRAPRNEGDDVTRFGDWVLDFSTRTLRNADDRPCALTPSEFALLEAFVRNANKVLTRDRLLENLRGENADVFDRTIDVLILRLRRKIERNPCQPQFIRTERGAGYIFCTQPEPA